MASLYDTATSLYDTTEKTNLRVSIWHSLYMKQSLYDTVFIWHKSRAYLYDTVYIEHKSIASLYDTATSLYDTTEKANQWRLYTTQQRLYIGMFIWHKRSLSFSDDYLAVSIWHSVYMTQSLCDTVSLWHKSGAYLYDTVSLWHSTYMTQSPNDTVSICHNVLTSLYDTPFIAMLEAYRDCVTKRLCHLEQCHIETVSLRDCVITTCNRRGTFLGHLSHSVSSS